jgi:putative transposase
VAYLIELPKGTCTQEFREQAVKLVLEEGLSLREAGQRLSLSPKTLQNWVIAARKGTLKAIGPSQPPLTELELELARLKRELAEVKLERDLLKKAAAYFAKEERGEGCRCQVRVTGNVATRVSRAPDGPGVRRVSQWLLRLAQTASVTACQGRLEVEIQAAHPRARETYGPERLQQDLAEHGVPVGVHRIKRIRKKLGLRCKQKRKFQAPSKPILP